VRGDKDQSGTFDLAEFTNLYKKTMLNPKIKAKHMHGAMGSPVPWRDRRTPRDRRDSSLSRPLSVRTPLSTHLAGAAANRTNVPCSMCKDRPPLEPWSHWATGQACPSHERAMQHV